MNKGYVKKGLRTSIKGNEVNFTIDSAVKISDTLIYRIRIALKVVNNTIVIKSFYILSNQA